MAQDLKDCIILTYEDVRKIFKIMGYEYNIPKKDLIELIESGDYDLIEKLKNFMKRVDNDHDKLNHLDDV